MDRIGHLAGGRPEQRSRLHTPAPVHFGDGPVDRPGLNPDLAGDLAQLAQCKAARGRLGGVVLIQVHGTPQDHGDLALLWLSSPLAAPSGAPHL